MALKAATKQIFLRLPAFLIACFYYRTYSTMVSSFDRLCFGQQSPPSTTIDGWGGEPIS